MHRLSIVTINLNNINGLNKTINSLIIQQNVSFEFIIIDGNSDDGSLNVIHEFGSFSKPHIDYNWISEPDNGVYNAMNKGIRMANGEYLLFLNSGDSLYDEKTLEKFLSSTLNHDIVVGDLIIKESENDKDYEIKKNPKNITAKYLFDSYIPHPSSFVKRSLFERVGLYNENNKIVSDWEFFIKALLLHNATFTTLDYPVGVFIADGLSCKPENSEIIDTEKQKVFSTYFPYYYMDYKEYYLLEKQNQDFKLSLDYKVALWMKNTGILYVVHQFSKILKKINRIMSSKKH